LRIANDREAHAVYVTRIRSDFGCYAIQPGPEAASNAVGYAKFFSRSHDAVIRVYDAAGKVIETHEHKGDFKEF
jgi:hypothetical protein